MTATIIRLAAAAGLLALSACTEYSDLDIGAGSQDSQAFGSAVTNNTVSQAVNLSASARLDLQERFRAAAPDRINFAFDDATLDADARAALDRQAAWIRANPAIRLRVYGHTDLVGSAAYNQRLGLRRAQAAVAYLVAQGVRRGQVDAVASFGETRPLIATPNRERLNRRTVTEVIGVDPRFRGYDFDGKVANNIYGGYTRAGQSSGTE